MNIVNNKQSLRLFQIGVNETDTLHQVNVPIHNITDCTMFQLNSSTQICAGDFTNYKDSCQGDSGLSLFSYKF